MPSTGTIKKISRIHFWLRRLFSKLEHGAEVAYVLSILVVVCLCQYLGCVLAPSRLVPVPLLLDDSCPNWWRDEIRAAIADWNYICGPDARIVFESEKGFSVTCARLPPKHLGRRYDDGNIVFSLATPLDKIPTAIRHEIGHSLGLVDSDEGGVMGSPLVGPAVLTIEDTLALHEAGWECIGPQVERPDAH